MNNLLMKINLLIFYFKLFMYKLKISLNITLILTYIKNLLISYNY